MVGSMLFLHYQYGTGPTYRIENYSSRNFLTVMAKFLSSLQETVRPTNLKMFSTKVQKWVDTKTMEEKTFAFLSEN